MSSPTLINDPLYWFRIYDIHIHAQKLPEDPSYFLAISPIKIPHNFSSRLVLCLANSVSAKQHWRTAGWMDQQYRMTGFDVPEILGKRVWIPLRKAKLIEFPDRNIDYEIVFNPPYWFEDIAITLWVYTGSSPYDIEEALTTLQANLQHLEAKVDLLF